MRGSPLKHKKLEWAALEFEDSLYLGYQHTEGGELDFVEGIASSPCAGHFPAATMRLRKPARRTLGFYDLKSQNASLLYI